MVLELYSGRIVSWSMQDSMTSQLMADALMMAVWRRGKPMAVLHHSDEGSQYTSKQFQDLLRKVYCSREQAGADVFDYIERFYNPRRRHSTLGYVSPIQFEKLRSASTEPQQPTQMF